MLLPFCAGRLLGWAEGDTLTPQPPPLAAHPTDPGRALLVPRCCPRSVGTCQGSQAEQLCPEISVPPVPLHPHCSLLAAITVVMH